MALLAKGSKLADADLTLWKPCVIFFSFDSIHFCFVLPTGNCKASQQVLIDFLTTLYLIDSSLKIRNPASLGDFPFCGTTNDDQVFTLVILPFIIHVFIP